MLELLQIENFQIHARQRIKLDPHVTTIVGPSDAGKSAILRAIRWLATNRPTGDEFIRHGQDRCRVGLVVDGVRIIRHRDGADNIYKLGSQTYRALGGGVPPEIEALLNIGDVNFQDQLDPPFWLRDTPGAVSRNLNAIVNLGIIDAVAGCLAAAHRRATTEAEFCEKRLEEALCKKTALAHVPALDVALTKVEQAATVAGTLACAAAGLAALIAGAEAARAAAKAAKQAAAVGRLALAAGTTAAKARTATKALAGLITALGKATAAARRRVPDIAPLTKAWKRAADAINKAETMGGLVGDAAAAINRREVALRQLADCKKQLALEFKGVCPVCSQPLPTT